MMSVKFVFICVLISQTSASFFDEFRGAMFSVEDSFGKLLSDVVSDVRETIGCTILAVKQVLALGGDFHESSDYDTLCKGQSDNGNSYVKEKQEYSPEPPFNIPLIPESRDDKNQNSLSERLSDELNDSIASAHDKVMNIIENHDTNNKLQQIRSNVEHESNRLLEISNLLHDELNNISKEVRNELSRVEIDYFHPTLEGIWHDIKELHNIERKYEGTKDANKIHHILDQILGVLRGSKSETDVASPTKTNDDDAEKTFALIENQFETMENQENIEKQPELTEISVEPVEVQNEESERTEEEDFPLTFQDVAKKIMKETRQSFHFADNSPQGYEELKRTTTEKIQMTTENPNIDAAISPDYAAFLHLTPEDSTSRKIAVQEATNLIENSKRTEAIMNNYFSKADSVGANVFDNPDLLGFG